MKLLKYFFIIIALLLFYNFSDYSKPSGLKFYLIECDSSIVYFNRDIQPILNSSCALSGCHNSESRKHGIILDTYGNVTGTTRIRYERPLKSEIYKKITEDDINDRMPPHPRDPLKPEQITIIGKWLEQGAKNLICEEKTEDCGKSPVSFSKNVNPIIEKNCIGCHDADNPKGIDFKQINILTEYAANGKIYGAITHSEGFKKMPRGANKLSDCNINTIKRWIDDGMKND